jgi:acyl-CoA synthetase (NDP forming)
MSAARAGHYDAATVETFFNPKVVAVIGASPDTLWSRQLLDGMRSHGFQGRVYVVNPSRSSVLGYQSFKSVADLPEKPDIAAVLLGAKHVPGMLEQVAATGCKAAYVLAAGFEKPHQMAALRAHAEKLGMIIIGPNCNGFINAGAGLHLWTGPINRPYRHGTVALLGQSSGVLGALCCLTWDRGLGISFQISTGNQVNFALTDALNFLATNADTRAVIVVAIGRSEAGRGAALGHTGAITTTGAITRAAIEAAGAIPVDTLDEALDRASVFAVTPPRAWRPVRSVGLVSISGGWSALMGDYFADEGLATPPLPKSVTKLLPDWVENVTFNNPFDITAQIYGFAEVYYQMADEMIKHDGYDAVSIMFGNWDGGERFYAPVATWQGRVQKPVVASCIETSALKDSYRDWLDSDPMPNVQGGQALARGLAAMRDYFDKPGYLPQGWCADKPKRWKGPAVATFPDMVKPLKAYGLNCAAHVTLLDSSGKAGKGKAPYPAVLKLESPGLPHKTEYGAVKVGIADDKACAAAVKALAAIAKKQKLDTWSIIAQPMLDLGNSLELLAGIVHDHVAGPVLTLGAGGVLAELFDKHAHALCPITPEQAEAMIDRIGVRKILNGYRGRPALDTASLVATLVGLSQFAYDHRGDLKELDLNPIVVPPAGTPTTLIDALARFGE